ncbi:hypothetical protein [Thauera humireducens]|uniref:hypothetical protein n=1 Tax=Thauera humireducens TaxID=1134435 RepID=UPI00311D8460
MTANSTTRMPTLFVPHGAGPCFFMDWNPPDAWNAMGDFLKNVASTLPARPSAIVVVSAHWLEPAFSVTSGPQPDLFYDYYGFPRTRANCAIRPPASRNWRRALPACSTRRNCRPDRTPRVASITACSFR